MERLPRAARAWGGGGGRSLQRTALLPAGREDALLRPPPSSGSPRLPDPGPGVGGTLFPLRREEEFGNRFRADYGLCPAWGFLSRVTPRTSVPRDSLPAPNLNALPPGIVPARRGAGQLAQPKSQCSSFRYPALLSHWPNTFRCVCNLSPPVALIINERAKMEQPLDFILRLSTSLPFPSSGIASAVLAIVWNVPFMEGCATINLVRP